MAGKLKKSSSHFTFSATDFTHTYLEKFILYSTVVLFLFGVSTNGRAQTDYTFELITFDSRANFGEVHNLYQDSAGVIWMGIFGKGLAYYNGSDIHQMPLPNAGSFSQHNDVFVAGGGFIFLNYGNSVKLFDPIKQEIVYSIALDPSLLHLGAISTIAFTKKENTLLVWATLELNQKSSDHKSTYQLLLSKDKAPFQQISTAAYTLEGEPTIKGIGHNVLVKTASGFLQLDELGRKIKSYPLPADELAVISTFNLLIDENQDIWFYSGGDYNGINATDNLVVTCFINQWERDADAAQKFPISWNRSQNLIRPQTKSQHPGRLSKLGRSFFLGNNQWFNFFKHSIEEISFTSVHSKSKAPSIYSSGQLFTMLEDETGVIWMGGTYGLGKMVPQPKAFKILPPISLRSFVEDGKGLIYGSVVWAITLDTKSSLLRHNTRVYDPATNEVRNLHVSGSFYQGTWYKAVFYKDKVYYQGNSLDLRTKAIKVYALEDKPEKLDLTLLDKKERLWMTGWGASDIMIYKPGQTKLIKKTTIPQLESKPVEINDWYQRPSDGSVWMGTNGQGVFTFTEDCDLSMHLQTSEGSPVLLNSNNVCGFYEDSKGNMWLGHGEGLSRISPNNSEIKHFYIDPKHPELRLVYSILPEDDDRFLWLSTSKGIFRFDTETGDCFDFPLHPKVMDAEYNRTAFYKAKSGQMFFGAEGTTLPTVSFFPDETMGYYENMELSQTKIVLDNFIKFDGKRETTTACNGLQAINKIVLNPSDRYFSLAFYATDYRSPKDNYYSFYLEGYEKDWNEPARNNNKIRYENLPPGKYTLKMRGALIRKNLPLNERQMVIVILPYWYQTWWSKILFVLLAGVVFYFSYKIRMTRQFELQEAARLRDLDDLKTRLYTNITHEFRTPLTVIMGMADNIHAHEQEKGLIKRNAKNLLRLINRLLDLSKLDSGTLKVDAVKGDIISYMQYLTESFYSMASDKKVNLTFKPETDTLIMDFDEVKVQHVIYNLLSNAIKFTRPGGKVALETGTSIINGKEYLQIKVKDTGIGIPESELPHIFDRFYQVDSTPASGNLSGSGKKEMTFSGTGIGLALTKELTELMGGHIAVKSELSWGTEFDVFLPIKQQVSTPKLGTSFVLKYPLPEPLDNFESLPTTPDQINGDRPLVLIIEDNSGVLTYIKSLLQKDYNLQVAINGQEGIDMALEHIPDLIITDVMMPEKNGFEVCEMLKKDERTSHIPIVMLTAKADIASKIEGLEMGADAYIPKPFEKEELLVRLRKLLELRQELQKYYAGQMPVISDAPANALSAPKSPDSLEDKFISKLKMAIIARLSDAEFSIPELCQSVQMSHTQLYRKLKALTGKTPSQFVTTVRLQKAIELIKTSELNISEIAYEVGFSDPNYFTRMFKKEYGKVPGELRV